VMTVLKEKGFSPTRYGYEDMASYALVISSEDPTTFQEAVNGQENSRWVGAMERRWSLYIRTRLRIWWSFQKGRG
jgi:hypothetical protein